MCRKRRSNFATIDCTFVSVRFCTIPTHTMLVIVGAAHVAPSEGNPAMPNNRPPPARTPPTAPRAARPSACLPQWSHKACDACIPAVELDDCEKLTKLMPLDDGMSTTTRAELRDVLCRLTADGEEQKAINELTQSANQEIQITNHELQASKVALLSLNSELAELNNRLEQTLLLQRTTSHDLQNILYSTEIATLFLDRALNIRFFTPATRSLFRLIPGDIGRPLADLAALVGDSALLRDAQAVLDDPAAREQEIEALGRWFIRRVLPYRTDDNGVEGVVITFTDVTERKHIARALEAAKQEAERANAAKSRFLAAASHDLRQPLQTLALLQGLLANTVEGAAAEKLVARLDDTLGAMSGMLNTVLDLNQIDAGVMRTDVVAFPIRGLLDRLRNEFSYHAKAQGLALHVMPCGQSVDSDPRLLEQMIRNLLSNALKYTRHGRVLLGCRRRGRVLTIEVFDTGLGIPEDKLKTIFEEYSQLDNAAHDRSKGLGLGLSIVQRLGQLLRHPVRVRSIDRRGSVFAIDVPLARDQPGPDSGPLRSSPEPSPAPASALACASASATASGIVDRLRSGAILLVEDDPAIRELLELFLRGQGHRVASAPDGEEALTIVTNGGFRPDLLLTDYNLPGSLTGLQLAERLRIGRSATFPVVVLTGDVSPASLREIARQHCVFSNKPVKLEWLTAAIQRLLPEKPILRSPQAKAARVAAAGASTIFIVDDDANVRRALREVLEAEGLLVQDHASSEAFLHAYRLDRRACLLIDAYLPGLSGLELLQRLRSNDDPLPAIMITGQSDVHMAVEAMRAGASDFIEKPIASAELLSSIKRALDHSVDSEKLSSWRETAASAVGGLTARQREVMKLVIAGHPSKNIAADLGISQRTVENHRAQVMQRTGCKSLPALARLALAAAWTGSDHSLVAAGPTASAVPTWTERRALAAARLPPAAGAFRNASAPRPV